MWARNAGRGGPWIRPSRAIFWDRHRVSGDRGSCRRCQGRGAARAARCRDIFRGISTAWPAEIAAAQARRRALREDEFQRGEGDERKEKTVEDPLRDFGDEPAAEEEPRDDGRDEGGVEK